MAKAGSKKFKGLDGKVNQLKAFEDRISLVTFLQYLDGGKDIGATLLQKNDQESYRVVFGFNCQGIAPILSEEEIFNTLGGLQALNDLPPRETLTVHFGLFIDDTIRQQQLRQQMEQISSPQLRLLVGGTAKRVRELTTAGIRKHNFLNLYVSYTVEENVESGGKGDVFDRVLGGIEKSWYQLNGSYKEVKSVAIQEILLEAYNRGYNRVQRLLANQVGLRIDPMSAAEVEASAWQIFNRSPASKRPLARVTIDVAQGTLTEKETEIHPKSYLLETTVPKAYRDRVCLKKGQHTGVLIFADKPDVPGEDEIAQLFYLHEIFSKESIYDVEVISQLRRGNNKLIKDKMSSLTKQAQTASKLAGERGEIDVGASLAVESAVEAQVALYQDEEPFHTGTVILVHRATPYLLNRACADTISYFRREGWVVREEEYAWKPWLEAYPFLSWDKLLFKPFNRQRTYVTSEISRILPLVCNRSRAQEGFELIATEGGTPIYLDIFREHSNVGIFAASGSGKSVLLSDLGVQLLAHGLPSTMLEFPRPDGTGSFDGLCEYLPEYCSYVDIGKSGQGLNLMELPDLRGLSPQDKKERFEGYKEEILGLLEAMVLGFKGKQAALDVNPDTVRALLLLSIEAFYSDPEIRERFASSFSRGFGSLEWQQMPTLVDFISFVSLERLRLSSNTGETLKTLEFIKLRLRYWLESRLGRFLSKVTTFPSDSLMQIISLRGLNNETDAAIMGSLSYLGAFRRSLKFPDSVFCIDEAPILLEFDAIARRIGELSANGRKSGIRLILAAQGLGSILKCVAADKILDNLSIKITGRIHSQSTDRYVEVLKYPYELIAENASERYGINKHESYTRWLYDDGRLIPVRHYPSRELLALVGNSTKEAKLRREFWQQYEGDKVRGLHELTNSFSGKVLPAQKIKA